MHEYKITADCESKDLIYLKMSKCAHKFELFYSAFESLCMGTRDVLYTLHKVALAKLEKFLKYLFKLLQVITIITSQNTKFD